MAMVRPFGRWLVKWPFNRPFAKQPMATNTTNLPFHFHDRQPTPSIEHHQPRLQHLGRYGIRVQERTLAMGQVA
jgi:hypothetical protein